MLAPLSFAAIYFLGTGAAGFLAVRSYDSRGAVARELSGLAICVAEWSFFYGLESLSRSPEYRQLWSQLAYVGTYGSVAFMLRFCIRWLTPRLVGWWMSLLWVVPLVMVVGAFTNDVHGLIWPEIRQSEVYSFIYRYSHGPLFWIGIGYQYILVVASLILVLVGIRRRRGIYRQQAAFVLVGILIAVLGNALYVSGALGPLELDITPLTLAIATGFLLAGVSHAQLLELLPAARHRVVDLMPDGLMVLDEAMRVVDWNVAAVNLWSINRANIMGTPITELVPEWEQVVPREPPDALNIALQQHDDAGVYHHIDTELRRVSSPAGQAGAWIVLFHDSTELRSAERRLQDVNARLEELNRELARQAVHDGLTGLYNRSYLDEALPRELARAERDERPVGLLILDIDHFKEVNDRHGHGVGDGVLTRVAELVRSQVRAGDIPCRYGGDELVAVMPGATADEALGIGQRIRVSVADARFADADESLSVTVSVGVAVYPRDAATAAELFRRADRALYGAKDRGRNRVVGAGNE